MRSNGDAGKDPRQLQREVEEQRREIGDTIHALEEKFSSREIYSQASGFFRDHGRDFAENFGNSIKANPLPFTLTAIGVAWMMMGQRQPVQRGYEPWDQDDHDMANDLYGNSTSIYGHGSDESGSKVKGGMEKAKGKGAEWKGKAASARDSASAKGSELRHRASAKGSELRGRASATGQQLRGSASHARDGLSRSMGSARSNFQHYMQEQPLAMGALGIALGALFGSSLPRTERENQALGDYGERARGKASEMAEQGYEKASQMGESVGRQAKEAFDAERHSKQQSSSTRASNPGPSSTP